MNTSEGMLLPNLLRPITIYLPTSKQIPIRMIKFKLQLTTLLSTTKFTPKKTKRICKHLVTINLSNRLSVYADNAVLV